MQTLIFTGNGGTGIALAATITASAAAQTGQRTLLASVGPSHSIHTLLGSTIANDIQTIAPNLDIWTLDAPGALNTYWEKARPRLPATLAGISGDELPTVPGLDFLLALERLYRPETPQYDLVIVDAGPHDMMLRVLSLPDSFRWMVRILFGLDRDPGQSIHSMSRALIPTSLFAFEWTDQVQNTRVHFEQLRSRVTDLHQTAVRYVLQPDTSVLESARFAVPALHLHGLLVDALFIGPLLPADTIDANLAGVAQQQQEVAAMAANIWQPRPLFRLPTHTPRSDVASFGALGKALYAGFQAGSIFSHDLPIQYGEDTAPFLSIRLPGLPRGALNLTLSGDELIIRVGPYRRHILLPEVLRSKTNIKASREDERLIIRLRE